MTTWTALTTLSDRVRADALGAALEALDPAPTGIGVFEVEDGSGTWEVGGYFIDPPDGVGLALLAAAPLIVALTLCFFLAAEPVLYLLKR